MSAVSYGPAAPKVGEDTTLHFDLDTGLFKYLYKLLVAKMRKEGVWDGRDKHPTIYLNGQPLQYQWRHIRSYFPTIEECYVKEHPEGLNTEFGVLKAQVKIFNPKEHILRQHPTKKNVPPINVFVGKKEVYKDFTLEVSASG